MIVYPDNLPMPELDGYSLKRQNNVLRTEMATGRARQRRRFVRVPSELSASWTCQAEQAALFEGFVVHALQDGANWFLMDVLTPAGLVQHQVRFISHPLEDCSPVGPRTWSYRARIEVEQRQVIDEQPLAEQLLAPNTIEQFADGVEDAVESYQE